MPLAWRLVRLLRLRPILIFTVYFVLVAILAIAPASSDITAFYLVASPWLLLFMLFLHVPVVGSAIQGFRLPEKVRVNHALEHGTIFFLRRRYGRKFKIGGKAEPDGFRLNGLPSAELVTEAFIELQEQLSRGNTGLVVSKYCGSMIVTAQALSSALLTLVAVLFLSFHLDSQTKIGLLVAVLLSYLLLRRKLGYVIQRRRFLSLEFQGAAIRSIKQVKPSGLYERRPVFFVRTIVH